MFSSGLFAALGRRNAIAVLMGIELMLNAANINLDCLLALRRHTDAQNRGRSDLSLLFVIAVAAAEVAVGLALIISVYRNRQARVNLDDLDILKG
jgi:NADH:ubiquinone oxidoreductase subunit K